MNLFEAIFAHDLAAPAIDPAIHPAIHFAGREISYGELRVRTLQMAAAITSLGVQRGDRVALLLHDSPEFVEAFIATCSLGAIAVPINMALRLEEQCSILHNCSATWALVEPELRSTFTTHAPEKLRALKKVLAITDLPQAQAPQSVKFPAPSDDEPAFILYTSGSTGEPKGAMHRQADIFYTNQTYCREVLSVKLNDRLFSSSRLPFAYGLGNSFTFPLMNGATSVLCREKPSPDVIARTFAECRPTIFFGVPVVYNLLLEHHRHKEPLDCSSLRLCVSAGEALPGHLGEEWEKTFGVQLLDGIGSTEMLHMFMSNHENEVRYGSSGKLLDGYEARLVDENGEPTPDDVEGNLWIKGDSAALGYWEKPEQSARTFVDGWVRTGDLYRRDSEGFWFHMGRSDDCFKSSGQWVSPVEVEGVLLRHPRVARAAVVEDFDAGGLPCPCAFVVAQELESDPSRLEQDLRESVAASLPRFKQPRRYVFVSELPYTATGKIQRFKLRQSLRK
ncbi:MAG TPA: benzoate-CoA ligase family protein [Pyrinomonadaceae bacterium]|nr:benzoate-CoA ligase family protein [Pyrinomonadaceae bacterium]